MKICVVTATYPIEGFGGVFIKEQCEQFAENGHDVYVLYCSGQLKSVHDFKVHYNDCKGVHVIYNCFPRYATTYAPRFWCNIMMRQLRILYKEMTGRIGKPDVIYAHFSFPAGKIATILGGEENIPVVIAEHWSGLITGRAKGSILKVIKEALSQANSIICVSPVLKEAIIRIIEKPDKVAIIPNMLSKEFVYHQRELKDNFVFFSLGTLNKKKQFDLLIYSFIEAFSVDDKVKLRIGGSGPDEEKLRQIIIDNNRSNQIEILGKLDRENTVSEYTFCDSFILLSPNETFGIVYREALAIGRPVISLDNGGIRYKWHDTNGIIIESTSEDIKRDVANAMKKMIKEINEFDIETISKTTLKDFSAMEVSRRIEDVLFSTAGSMRH